MMRPPFLMLAAGATVGAAVGTATTPVWIVGCAAGAAAGFGAVVGAAGACVGLGGAEVAAGGAAGWQAANRVVVAPPTATKARLMRPRRDTDRAKGSRSTGEILPCYGCVRAPRRRGRILPLLPIGD